jgi:hypothetical protein
MSSALAMILAASMTVPGIGPEKVSGEVDSRLDLTGIWQLTFEQNHLIGDFVLVESGPNLMETFDIRVEGHGRVRLRLTMELLGIYKQEGDCIVISCARVRDSWPTSFEKKIPYVHIILRRVKPRN